MDRVVAALPRRLPRALQWCAALLLLGLGLGSVRHHLTLGPDFLIAVWYPGRLLYRGIDPYDVGKFQHALNENGAFCLSHQVCGSTLGWLPPYAPNHLWLGVLFGPLPASLATAIWFCLNVAMLILL